MKKLIIVSILSALSLTALAQDSDVTTVTVTPKKAAMISDHRYPMQSDEFYKFKGAYDLSNGSTVSLYNRGALLYAKLDNGVPERIVATSQNTFLSTKSDLKLKIKFQDNGDVKGEAFLPAAYGKVSLN